MCNKLQSIGLTDFYFKELCQQRKDYLVFILNGICNLNLKESDIEFSNTEERDSCTFKTINYDIKVVSSNIKIDIEAQIKQNFKEKNENGEYIYDIARSFYYLSVLHSRGYDYKEKGYEKRRSIVVFLYKYDIAGDDFIQKIGMHNYSTKVDYDDMLIYSVSLEKIPSESKIELERALKLLSALDMTPYLDDESILIRRAADMLCDYDKSEKAQLERDARNKSELEKYTLINTAKAEGIEEGIEKGKKENQLETIKILFETGLSKEDIAKHLRLDLEYVKEVLK